MKLAPFLYCSILTLLLFSCNNNAENNDHQETVDTSSVVIDTNTVSIDTTSVLPDSLQEAGYVDESEETTNIIEQKYGEQWDFCDCVVKNDSVNKAIETASDEEIDAIFDRMTVIDNHCKELIATPNTTPEDRQKHERKVRKCLKNAGIK